MERTGMKLAHFNRRVFRLVLASVLAVAVCSLSVNSHAGTGNATLMVSVEVIANCTVSSVPAASGAVSTACSDDPSAAVITSRGASPASSEPAGAAIDQGGMPDSQNQPADAGSDGIQVVTVLF
jgi:hypothetical protein